MSVNSDLDYLPAVERAARDRGAGFAYILTLLVLVFLAAFGVWAHYAVLDEVTRGEARVIPSQRVQVVQNLEGGILSEIYVTEGDIVEKGQTLLRIDNTLAEAQVRESQSRINSLRAAIIRLEAEIAGEEPVFPESLREAAPEVVADEISLHRVRMQEYARRREVLSSQAEQRQQEIEELQSRRDQLGETLQISRRELAMVRPLAPRVVSEREVLALEREVADMRGELRTVELSITRAEFAHEEALGRLEELESTFRREASADLTDRRREVEALKEITVAGEDRVVRTEVVSPVRGTVQEIFYNTIGGVIAPGKDILEIVPLDDSLLIEAKIKPSDIAFIRPGLDAKVKITAYDFSIYGSLAGVVENISPDTDTDEQGNTFYRVYLRTQQNSFQKGGEEYPISPGMTASVDILTGEKSVLDYLLKPILKARENALTER
jgi:adhesin transport system membrane fusion protein